VGIYGRIDVLVNNAAYSLLGMLEDLTYVYSELRSLATVNSFST
jgi:NAD(P)-dependent dehydrogenase (short-subunit alcohol dehydrogenase family)